jgi:hypothetical protein
MSTGSNYITATCYYLFQNGITGIDPTQLNFNLFTITIDNQITYRFSLWNVPDVEEPSFALLDSYDPAVVQAYVVTYLKAKYTAVLSTLRSKRPEFSLVFEMFHVLCTTSLGSNNLTEQQFQALTVTAWNNWCDSTPT